MSGSAAKFTTSVFNHDLDVIETNSFWIKHRAKNVFDRLHRQYERKAHFGLAFFREDGNGNETMLAVKYPGELAVTFLPGYQGNFPGLA